MDIDSHLNESLSRQLQSLSEEQIRQQSHFFNGRYENIYLNKNAVPELDRVLQIIKHHISEHYSIPLDRMKFGFWLNKMLAGDMTTRHRHDDDDEVLSGVYYITAPKNSGNLILYAANETIEIEPMAGKLVLFSPSLEHEVRQNCSTTARLSIGFNAGIESP